MITDFTFKNLKIYQKYLTIKKIFFKNKFFFQELHLNSYSSTVFFGLFLKNIHKVDFIVIWDICIV
ncbi:hypothetical protein Msp_0771 [Methanosphaera stadtmanae DSM 3091]|uniref:Uncharacterized protein n=1 Tax=Methanosphaera stadtmanae (strain ATCC 43021 / DSM 3091 / JCM 11832 / MCB-3) TaxID=339860 RepID=Q2NG89_METST|nr:hypothetical protein Msp_0771 [Methanosphaera stadtmanae DSM 3091]